MFETRLADTIGAVLGVIVGSVIGFSINLLIGGFVAVVFLSYWGWFVEPLGVAEISFFHAWGLVVMSGLVIPTPQLTGDRDERLKYVKRALAGVALAWPFGLALSALSS